MELASPSLAQRKVAAVAGDIAPSPAARKDVANRSFSIVGPHSLKQSRQRMPLRCACKPSQLHALPHRIHQAAFGPAGLRGLPPLRPFSRAVAFLTSNVALPPRLPNSPARKLVGSIAGNTWLNSPCTLIWISKASNSIAEPSGHTFKWASWPGLRRARAPIQAQGIRNPTSRVVKLSTESRSGT